jgi:hypothetical protein
MVQSPALQNTRPVAVRRSILLWLAAIGAGVAEALVHVAQADAPSTGALAVRFTIYAALTALVLALRTGRNAVRWVVAVLLGGIGTLSLVVEPVSWWTAGGSVPAFLAAADGPTLLITGLRLFHVLAVLAALVLVFRPQANRFFRTA